MSVCSFIRTNPSLWLEAGRYEGNKGEGFVPADVRLAMPVSPFNRGLELKEVFGFFKPVRSWRLDPELGCWHVCRPDLLGAEMRLPI